jgi:hypothetical protein
MASSWSNMPAWLAQRDAGIIGGSGIAGSLTGLGIASMHALGSGSMARSPGNGMAIGSFGAGNAMPIPARPRPMSSAYAGRGVGLLAASMDRQDTIMGVSIGTSLGERGAAQTPGSELGGFLFGASHPSLAQSPNAMEFSPSNFFAGPTR